MLRRKPTCHIVYTSAHLYPAHLTSLLLPATVPLMTVKVILTKKFVYKREIMKGSEAQWSNPPLLPKEVYIALRKVI